MQTVSFGKNRNGEETSLYIFENSNHGVMKVSDHGATLVSLLVPDREGAMRDVVLGYDTAAEYESHTCYFGATVGRNGNRIDSAKVVIEGREYQLAAAPTALKECCGK